MSVIGDIRVSLDAIGVEQQAFLFAFLTSYPLAIGGLLAERARRIAGIAAATSLLGFAALTTPWFHGVLLAVVIIAGMGLLIAAVWTMHWLQRLLERRVETEALDAEVPLAAPEAARERDGRRRPKLPLTGRAGTT